MPEEKILLTCIFDGKEVDPDSPLVLQRVWGWVHPRTAGGPNAIVGRRPLPQWACPSCAQKIHRGIDPRQEDLF